MFDILRVCSGWAAIMIGMDTIRPLTWESPAYLYSSELEVVPQHMVWHLNAHGVRP